MSWPVPAGSKPASDSGSQDVKQYALQHIRLFVGSHRDVPIVILRPRTWQIAGSEDLKEDDVNWDGVTLVELWDVILEIAEDRLAAGNRALKIERIAIEGKRYLRLRYA